MFTTKPFFSEPMTRSVLKKSLFPQKGAAQSPLFRLTFSSLPSSFLGKNFGYSFCNFSHQSQNQNQFDEAQKNITSENPKEKISSESKKISLNKFLFKMYTTTCFSISASLGISYLLATYPSLAVDPTGGLASLIAGFYVLNRTPPEIIIEDGKEIFKNSRRRKFAFSAIIASAGWILSPGMSMLLGWNPAVFPMIAGISIFSMGCLSLYAKFKPLEEFSILESAVCSTVGGYFGMQTLALASTMILGANPLSLTCGGVKLIAGLILYNALQAYHTQVAIKNYHAANHDHLDHLMQFFKRIRFDILFFITFYFLVIR